MAQKQTAHPRDTISDKAWAAIKPTLPKGVQKGSVRLFLEAVAHRARTGCPCRDLPERFGHWHKSHVRFSKSRFILNFIRLFGSAPETFIFTFGIRIVRSAKLLGSGVLEHGTFTSFQEGLIARKTGTTSKPPVLWH